jgi:TonB family protein
MSTVFGQENFNRDTLFYHSRVQVYEIDFFGLERVLHWDTISKISGIEQVVLNFKNKTLAPIEVKKYSEKGRVISWRFQEGKVTIPPGGTYKVSANYNFIEGEFQSDLNIRFKHLGKRHELGLHTYGVAEQVNELNAAGNKQGRWIEVRQNGQVKREELYSDGALIKAMEYHFYSNGNLRLQMDENNHVHTYYLETGERDFEMRPNSRTDYYPSGSIKSVETHKEIVYNDENGKYLRRKRQFKSKVLNDYKMLIEEEFFPNGNLKMQNYSNGEQFFYANDIDGCLTKMIDGKFEEPEKIYTYENCEVVEVISSHNHFSDRTGSSPTTIESGSFEGDKLISGTVEYYYNHGEVLSYIGEVKNGGPTGAIWVGGVKYNGTNEKGHRHGVWVSNQHHFGSWSVSAKNEILLKGYFENGRIRDTVFYYNSDGKVKSITLESTNRAMPSSIKYYASGNISAKTYSFIEPYSRRVYKTENYEDAPNGVVTGMSMNGFSFAYKRAKLNSRKSPIHVVDGSRILPNKNRRQYTIATGEFRKEHIYNGKIAYYNDYDHLLRTVRVTAGKINGDRILVFDDLALEMELTKAKSTLDSDHNGYITRSEAKSITTLAIGGSWIESAADFKYFYNLKSLKVNGWNIDPYYFNNEEELLKQIQLCANKSAPSKRDPWDPWPVPEPDPDPIPIVRKVYDYVEVEPVYPGGPEAMMNFIKENLKYPVADSIAGIQGTVYVQFVVNDNGSLEKATIRKGVSDALDKEALRLIKLMPNWKPGEQAGKPVNVKFTLPVRFRLEN